MIGRERLACATAAKPPKRVRMGLGGSDFRRAFE
jgi:hypothetical protein